MTPTDTTAEKRPENRPATPRVRAARPVITRSRVMIAVAVIGVLALAGLAYFAYTTTPDYSFRQVLSSARAKNWDGVRRYANLPAINGLLWDNVVKEQLPTVEAAGFPSIVPGRDEFIAKATEQLRLELENSATTTDTLTNLFGLNADVGSVKSSQDGTEVLLTVEMKRPGGTTFDIFRLRKYGNHWRVMQIEDLTDMLKADPAALKALVSRYGFTQKFN